MSSIPALAIRSHTKRSLLALSHAMERSIEAGRGESDEVLPPLVIAMFQRPEYFAIERDRYRELGASGAVCASSGSQDQLMRCRRASPASA
jgi:DICT domain-containing protein